MKEEKWRLKIKTICIAEGNKNTHFFHNLSSKRKKANSIWHIRDGKNNVLTKWNDIQKEVV